MSHYPTCRVGQDYPSHPVEHCAECAIIGRALSTQLGNGQCCRYSVIGCVNRNPTASQ